MTEADLEQLVETLDTFIDDYPNESDNLFGLLQKWENLWSAWHRGDTRFVMAVAKQLGWQARHAATYMDARRTFSEYPLLPAQAMMECLDLTFKADIIRQTHPVGNLAVQLDNSDDTDLQAAYAEPLATIQEETINLLRKFNLTFSIDGKVLIDMRNGIANDTSWTLLLDDVITETEGVEIPVPDNGSTELFHAYDTFHDSYRPEGTVYDTHHRFAPTPIPSEESFTTHPEYISITQTCYEALLKKEATIADLREQLQRRKAAWKHLNARSAKTRTKGMAEVKQWLEWDNGWKEPWMAMRAAYLGEEAALRRHTQPEDRAAVELLDLLVKSQAVTLISSLEDLSTEVDSLTVAYPHLSELNRKFDIYLHELHSLMEHSNLSLGLEEDLDDEPAPPVVHIDQTNFDEFATQTIGATVLEDDRGLELPITHLQTFRNIATRIQAGAGSDTLNGDDHAVLEDLLLRYDSAWVIIQLTQERDIVSEAETYHLPRC